MRLPEDRPAAEEEERLEEAEAALDGRGVEGDGFGTHGTSLALAVAASARKNSRDFVSVSSHSQERVRVPDDPAAGMVGDGPRARTTAVRIATLKTAVPSPRTYPAAPV